jgi:hypothetical protein
LTRQSHQKETSCEGGGCAGQATAFLVSLTISPPATAFGPPPNAPLSVPGHVFVVLQNAPSGRLHVQVNVKKLIYDAFESNSSTGLIEKR